MNLVRGGYMSNTKYKRKNKRRKPNAITNSIIKRQSDEIKRLKKQIADLNVSCEKKDELLHSVDGLQKEMVDVVDGIKAKGDEYDKLIAELKLMRKALNKEVFKGRWPLVKWLIKVK